MRVRGQVIDRLARALHERGVSGKVRDEAVRDVAA